MLFRPRRHDLRWRTAASTLATVAIAAGAASAASAADTPSPATATSPASTAPSTTATTPTKTSPAAKTPTVPVALRLVHVSPLGTVPGDAAITFRFSAPLAAAEPKLPQFSPSLTGTWSRPTPSSLRFQPKGAYQPGTVVHVSVPARLKAADGAVLGHVVTHAYTVGQPSATRLAQLLADLRFLPVHFVSSDDPPAGDGTAQLRALYSPPGGRFTFGHGWPAQLHSLWATDQAEVLRGAVMSFESQHGLSMNGTVDPALWSALVKARVDRQLNTAGYSYALASEASPESLTIWHNGGQALHTAANTGIPGSSTAQGTFPVYSRLRSQVMQGTNPDGSHYADPVQFVAYFNGGDAVHYMPRADYGIPQSLGCVELPYDAAEQAWGYLSYGTLVTVGG